MSLWRVVITFRDEDYKSKKGRGEVGYPLWKMELRNRWIPRE